MKAAPEIAAAHLEDPKPPALRPVLKRVMFQPDHPMDEAMQVQIVGLISEIVQEQHRATLLGKKVLERDHLAAIAQRILRQQANFRQTIELGATRRTSSNVILVVSPSSRSDAYITVCCCFGSRLSSAGTNSKISMPSRFQPCVSATAPTRLSFLRE
jgi:hypothetical protein